MSEIIKVPCMRLHPTHAVIYYETIGHHHSNFNSDNLPKHMPYNSNRGRLSSNARRKMEKSINYLSFLAEEKKVSCRHKSGNLKFKISFLTLTLPSAQIHSDNFIKSKCLNQLLTELRQKYKVKRYVWVAEKQKNLNIHIHMLIDRYIDCFELRDLWNRIINKYGYVDSYRQKMQMLHSKGFKVNKQILAQWGVESQLKAYHNGIKTNWSSPNSTDVHSVKNVRNIAAYAAKYMSKGANRTIERVSAIDIEFKSALETYQVSVSTGALKYLNSLAERGRLWGCSYDLSSIKGADEIVDSEISDLFYSLTKEKRSYSFSDTYFSVVYFDFDRLLSPRYERLLELLDKYLYATFGYSRQRTLNEIKV